MTNNDILRRIRYTFDFKDKEVVEIFALADVTVTLEQVAAWMKRDEDEAFVQMNSIELSSFLNGLINLKRGKRDGEQPQPDAHLSNNMVFQKLRIALNLKAEDILEILELANFRLSKHELSAFFRKPDNKHYRQCKDQILRNFLMGVQLKLRPEDQTEYQD
ncbi:hypothetical protein RN22_21755 [Grimontia sp. AD028]|uniref:Glutamate synthase [NADPH] large chain n=1 Tax=Grimontia indica TaxID=1056512 RepID=R1GXR2_9GAMM|nr:MULTISPECIES: DUF1456 family protein [Grimontia]EOD80844.1 hypothetical protein D515_04823 [Grimontia indica]KKD58285.1 hypothetical protein RN22_21755 [Grimontia sp. AD028]